MSERFNELPPTSIDQIMVANAEWPSFLAEHPDAVNTTIGVLIDPSSGKPWQPQSVQEARQLALDEVLEEGQHGYQSQQGYKAFNNAVAEKVFGPDVYYGGSEIFAYQTLGGTGALSLAKEVLVESLARDDDKKIPMVLDGGWPNHRAIFSEPFDVSQYPHMDSESGAYNHQAALDAFGQAPKNSVFLLQTCGYNDDGMDRTPQQWDEILDIAEQKHAVVLLDSAYMGLVAGYDQERYPIVQSVKRKLLTLVSFSASKNMGLYNERLGALFIANASRNLGVEQASRLNKLVSRAVRRTTSSPPLVVAKAADKALKMQGYHLELAKARLQLNLNRQIFGRILKDELPAVAEGKGLFTKIFAGGFSDEQQAIMAQEGVFTLPNSRINLGGIKEDQVERVGHAVLRTLKANLTPYV